MFAQSLVITQGKFEGKPWLGRLNVRGRRCRLSRHGSGWKKERSNDDSMVSQVGHCAGQGGWLSIHDKWNISTSWTLPYPVIRANRSHFFRSGMFCPLLVRFTDVVIYNSSSQLYSRLTWSQRASFHGLQQFNWWSRNYANIRMHYASSTSCILTQSPP